MASAILFAFSLFLLLCAVFSKPVAQDFNSVNPSDSVTLKHETKTIVTSAEVSDPGLLRSVDSVPSLYAVVDPSLADSDERFRRVKRQVMRGRGCPKNRIWYKKKCMTFKRYAKLVQEEDEEK